METAQLYQSLTFLAYATGVIVILVGGMLIKVLFDLSKLTKKVDETAEMVKTELTPTLQNINKSVAIVSGIISATKYMVYICLRNFSLPSLNFLKNALNRFILIRSPKSEHPSYLTELYRRNEPVYRIKYLHIQHRIRQPALHLYN